MAGPWAPRWRTRAVATLAALLLAVLGLALAWAWLQSPAGEALLLGQVRTALAGAVAGPLDVRTLRLDGLEVVLEGLALRTPEGQVVATAETVRARLDVASALRGVVRVAGLQVDGVWALVAEDARGVGLVRALATSGAASGGAGPLVEVDEVRVTRATLVGRQGEVEVARLQVDEATGSAAWRVGTAEVRGRLGASGALSTGGRAPVPLRLTAGAGAAEGGRGTQALVTLGLGRPGPEETQVEAAVDVAAARLDVRRARLSPAPVAALFPGWPLREVVEGTGTLTPSSVQTQWALAGGTVRASATASADGAGLATVEVTAEGVESARLLGRGESLRLSGRLWGRAPSLRPLQGE